MAPINMALQCWNNSLSSRYFLSFAGMRVRQLSQIAQFNPVRKIEQGDPYKCVLQTWQLFQSF